MEFYFTLTLKSDGQFTADGTVVAKGYYNDGRFTATGKWWRDAERGWIHLDGAWTSAGSRYGGFSPAFTARPGEWLGYASTQRWFVDDTYSTASCGRTPLSR